MKIIFRCILVIALCIHLLAGCSDQSIATKDPTVTSTVVDNQNEISPTLQTAPEEIPTPKLTALEYLKSVVYISNEWTDGSYVVYGTDKSNNNCCGILYANGGFEPLKDYAVYYPLADGNLFVTNDNSFIRDYNYARRQDSNRNSLCATGKIIDRDGNILYEPDANGPYQKMYVVNSHTILVLAVSSGFDGMEVYWGVLDNKGNWVHQLDNTGVLVEKIKEHNLLEMNSDGSWSYANTDKKMTWLSSEGKLGYDHRILYTSQGGAYDDSENQSLIFYMETAYDDETKTKNGEIIVYQASNHSFIEFEPSYELGEFTDIGSLQQVSDNQWIQVWSIYSSSSYTSYDYTVYDSSGSNSRIRDYIVTEADIKYW